MLDSKIACALRMQQLTDLQRRRSMLTHYKDLENDILGIIIIHKTRGHLPSTTFLNILIKLFGTLGKFKYNLVLHIHVRIFKTVTFFVCISAT